MRTYILGALLCLVAHAADAPEVTFYLVESATQTSAGKQVGSSISLIKRSVDRAQSLIEENVVSLRGSAPGQEFVTVLKLDGSKAKMSCANCGIEGEGEFSGEPWNWTGFKFTSTVGGQKVAGEDTFSPTGITAEKRVLGPDGTPRVVIKENGWVITEATYQLLRSRLMPK